MSPLSGLGIFFDPLPVVDTTGYEQPNPPDLRGG